MTSCADEGEVVRAVVLRCPATRSTRAAADFSVRGGGASLREVDLGELASDVIERDRLDREGEVSSRDADICTLELKWQLLLLKCPVIRQLNCITSETCQ